jgi:hypothetical protein
LGLSDDHQEEAPWRKQQGEWRRYCGVSLGYALPKVSTQTLQRYHAYLQANLALPFNTEDRHGPIEVAALVHVKECPYLELYGLFYRGVQGRRMIEIPLAEIEAVQDAGQNQQLIADYRWWFWQ